MIRENVKIASDLVCKILQDSLFRKSLGALFAVGISGLAYPSLANTSVVWVVDHASNENGLRYYDYSSDSNCANPCNVNNRDVLSNYQEHKIKILENTNSWARLYYGLGGPIDDGRMGIQLGPTEDTTEFWHPCSGGNGEFRVAIYVNSSTECSQEGIQIWGNWEKSKVSYNPLSHFVAASKRILSQKSLISQLPAQGYSNFVVFKPVTNEQGYVEIENDADTEIVINVLEGDFNIITADGQERIITEGSRYLYDGREPRVEALTAQEISSIINSPETQDFLDPNNWDLSTLPVRVSESLTQNMNDLNLSMGNVIEPVLGSGDVQVTLRWQTEDDLDLFVLDPLGEEIGYITPESTSGGELDVDANIGCNGSNLSPVENIFWPANGAPNGQYSARVELTSQCNSSDPINYTLTIKNQEEIRTYQGSLQVEGSSSSSYSFTFQ